MSTTAESHALQEELDLFDARFLRAVRERLRAYEEQLQRVLDAGDNDRGIYATMVNVRAALEYVAARELQLPALANGLSATLTGWPAGLAAGVAVAQGDAIADSNADDDDVPALLDVDDIPGLLDVSDSSAEDDDDDGIRALIADGHLRPVIVVDGQVAAADTEEDDDDLPPLMYVTDSEEEESEASCAEDEDSDASSDTGAAAPRVAAQ